MSSELLRIEPHELNVIRSHQTCFPVKVGSIAKELNVKVLSSTMGPGISGSITIEGGHYTIRANRHDVKERQRFTVAHELGHYLLHRSMIGDGIVDDVLYRSSLSNSLEAEANRLAAEIIMPWTLMEKSIKRYSDLGDVAMMEFIAKEAEVSLTAIKIRLGKA